MRALDFAGRLLASAVFLPFLMPLYVLGVSPFEVVAALFWEGE